MLPAVWGYIDIKADGLTFPHLGDGAVVAAAPGVLPLRDSNPHTPTEVALESCESARSNPQFVFFGSTHHFATHVVGQDAANAQRLEPMSCYFF